MPTILPRSPDLQHIRKRAKQLLHEHREGNRSVGDRIRHHHARFAGTALSEILAADFSLQDAQLVVAREFGQSNWSRLTAVVELLRQVHQTFESGGCVHVIASDADQAHTFEGLLQPHYSTDQLGLLPSYVRGERVQSALSRSTRILLHLPILVAEYQVLGRTYLLEHYHKPEGPFQVDMQLARTRAIFPRSVYSRRPVVHGIKKHNDEKSEFDHVLELSIQQLGELFGSISVINL